MEIDVDKVLKQKSPVLARWMPRFAVNYLRRIVHQDELNEMMHKYSHLPTMEFVRASLKEMNISYHSCGMEQLDDSARYIFASNHPFGGLDGLMLADEVSHKFTDVMVVVNDILINVAPLSPICIPVNKHGRQNAEYLRLHNKAFSSSVPIVTFPAGLCSRRIDGKVQDLKWKPNFVKRAIADKRDVVPVHFEGELSSFFYRMYNLRTWLGIKTNIEMLYLVDEMFKQSGGEFAIIIGKPIAWQQLANGESPAVWCERIREISDSLGSDVNCVFDKMAQ